MSMASTSFNPRSPCGERRERRAWCSLMTRGFNPRSPCGERLAVQAVQHQFRQCFNPRSPCGERQSPSSRKQSTRLVSTHAPLAGSDFGGGLLRLHLLVSTHAPLAGSDALLLAVLRVHQIVSTHAPLAGSDGSGWVDEAGASMFQPTLPLRGATQATAMAQIAAMFQPTLPLRGATATSC